MKKLVVSLVFVGLSVVYVLSRSSTAPAPSASSGGDANTASAPATPVPTQTTPTPTPSMMTGQTMPMMGRYKNGVYTGDTIDAFYGLVQVKATIRNGKLADVTPLQYPNDRENSIRISQESLPLLIEEAIQVQSANVDIVSGATETSIAFKESLGTALAKAKN